MNKFESKENYLVDLLDYYSVSPEERRCVGSPQCFYSPITLNKLTSEGCAIGRNMTPENAKKLDELEPDGMWYSDCVTKYRELFPKEMLLLNTMFLQRCQGFHDDGDNWDAWGNEVEKELNI
jgi:hypothetical protein